MLHRHDQQNHQYHQMPRITYNTIIIHRLERFLIAASPFELIFDVGLGARVKILSSKGLLS